MKLFQSEQDMSDLEEEEDYNDDNVALYVNDPELEKSRKQLEKAMFGISAKELREETDTRNHVKSEVDDILKRMSF